jgi:hypothetical protein
MVLFVVGWMGLKFYFLISENHKEAQNKIAQRFDGIFKSK